MMELLCNNLKANRLIEIAQTNIEVIGVVKKDEDPFSM